METAPITLKPSEPGGGGVFRKRFLTGVMGVSSNSLEEKINWDTMNNKAKIAGYPSESLLISITLFLHFFEVLGLKDRVSININISTLISSIDLPMRVASAQLLVYQPV